jgi:hypothetical protein
VLHAWHVGPARRPEGQLGRSENSLPGRIRDELTRWLAQTLQVWWYWTSEWPDIEMHHVTYRTMPAYSLYCPRKKKKKNNQIL